MRQQLAQALEEENPHEAVDHGMSLYFEYFLNARIVGQETVGLI
jgi:hypothetical protein